MLPLKPYVCFMVLVSMLSRTWMSLTVRGARANEYVIEGRRHVLMILIRWLGEAYEFSR